MNNNVNRVELDYQSEEDSLLAENYENNFESLDPIKKAFCIEYASNGWRARVAAKAAGVSCKVATPWLREPLCVAYIEIWNNRRKAEAIVTREVLDANLDYLEDIAMGYRGVPTMNCLGEIVNVPRFMPKLVMGLYRERVKLHGLGPKTAEKCTQKVVVDVVY